MTFEPSREELRKQLHKYPGGERSRQLVPRAQRPPGRSTLLYSGSSQIVVARRSGREEVMGDGVGAMPGAGRRHITSGLRSHYVDFVCEVRGYGCVLSSEVIFDSCFKRAAVATVLKIDYERGEG